MRHADFPDITQQGVMEGILPFVSKKGKLILCPKLVVLKINARGNIVMICCNNLKKIKQTSRLSRMARVQQFDWKRRQQA